MFSLTGLGLPLLVSSCLILTNPASRASRLWPRTVCPWPNLSQAMPSVQHAKCPSFIHRTSQKDPKGKHVALEDLCRITTCTTPF